MYSTDFRAFAVRLFSEGKSYRHIAQLLKISSSTVHQWVNKGILPKQRQKSDPSPEVVNFVAESVASNPVTSQQQLKRGLEIAVSE